MELSTILALNIISNASWGILAIGLVYFLMPRLIIAEEFYVHRTSDLIRKRGILSLSTEASIFESAGLGFHLVRLGAVIYLVHKSMGSSSGRGGGKAQYVVYGFFLRRFYRVIARDENMEVAYHIEQSNQYCWNTFPTICPMISAPYAFQEEVGEKIVKLYKQDKRVSALVCGKPGIGKSSLVYVVKGMLVKAGKAPTIVTGFRFTTIGMCLNMLTSFGAAEDTPLIVDIAEVDRAIDFAESGGRKEKECPARDRQR
jgi:hypothetical protein